MPNPNIGHITCPSCDHPDAAVRQANTKKSFAYVMCEECGYQGFARDPRADANLRRKMRPLELPPAAAVPPAALSPKQPEPKPADKGWGTLLG